MSCSHEQYNADRCDLSSQGTCQTFKGTKSRRKHVIIRRKKRTLLLRLYSIEKLRMKKRLMVRWITRDKFRSRDKATLSMQLHFFFCLVYASIVFFYAPRIFLSVRLVWTFSFSSWLVDCFGPFKLSRYIITEQLVLLIFNEKLSSSFSPRGTRPMTLVLSQQRFRPNLHNSHDNIGLEVFSSIIIFFFFDILQVLLRLWNSGNG